MKIINDIKDGKIEEIKEFDTDDFMFFITRISAEPLCEYQMLYSYDHFLDKCRQDVYNDIIDKTFKEQADKIKIMTIDEMFETKSYTLYDTVFVNESFLPVYLKEKSINPNSLRNLIMTFEDKGLLEELIKIIPIEYIEKAEEIIMDELNNSTINQSGLKMEYMYSELIKRDNQLVKVKEK